MSDYDNKKGQEKTDSCFLTSVIEYGNDGFYEERFILSCDSCGGSLDELSYDDLRNIELLLHNYIEKREGGAL